MLGVHWWAYGGRGGLQHGDIHAVGLFDPPCARWLVLGAVASLVASLAAAAVVGVCVGGGGLGRRVCCLPRLVAVLGLYGGPFLLLSCKIYVYIVLLCNRKFIMDIVKSFLFLF